MLYYTEHLQGVVLEGVEVSETPDAQQIPGMKACLVLFGLFMGEKSEKK